MQARQAMVGSFGCPMSLTSLPTLRTRLACRMDDAAMAEGSLGVCLKVWQCSGGVVCREADAEPF